MLICLCLACTNDHPAGDDPQNGPDAAPRYEFHSVRACAIIADDSPSFPDRLVFLHRTDNDNLDAQTDLYGVGTTKFRCGEMTLHLLPRRDRTPVHMDFIPPANAVKLRELRIYRFDAAWDPEDPFALAKDDHQPFRDYAFNVNLVSPPNDASTILLPP